MLKNTKERAAYAGAAIGTALTMVLFVAGAASATPVDPGETAISDVSAKVTTYGTAVLAIAVLAVGIALAMKYIRKARAAS